MIKCSDTDSCTCWGCQTFNKMYDLSDAIDGLATRFGKWLDEKQRYPDVVIDSCINSIVAQMERIDRIISSES